MTEHRIDLRPWIAALLGSIVTGLGHLYLRRVRRAFGWLAAAVLTRGTETVNCPACGRPLDLDLDFCPWCTTRFEQFEVREVEG